MNFSTSIAKRFIFSKKELGPSRFMGRVAITGLAVGCSAMILSISVLNKFEKKVTSKIIGFEGDVRISKAQNWKVISDALSKDDYVKSFMSFKQRNGLILNGQGSQQMILLKAISLDSISSFYDLGIFHAPKTNFPLIYIGETTARRLNVGVGGELRIMSPVDQGSSLGFPRQFRMIVGGIFDIQILDLNDKVAFISIDIGNKLFLRKNSLDGIDIRLKNKELLGNFLINYKKKYPKTLFNSWGDLHKELFSAMRFEKIGSFIVLSLIILVACFNLAATLILVSAQKKREFAILKSMGANIFSIKMIILKQGFLIGIIGIGLGIFFGLFLVFIQNIFGIIKLPNDIYFTSYLPMIILPFDIIFVLFTSFIMVALSSFIATKNSTNQIIIETINSKK